MATVTLRFLEFHWGESYTFSAQDNKYSATAKFGKHDRLIADTPGQLLHLVRQHYPGTRAELAST